MRTASPGSTSRNAPPMWAWAPGRVFRLPVALRHIGAGSVALGTPSIPVKNLGPNGTNDVRGRFDDLAGSMWTLRCCVRAVGRDYQRPEGRGEHRAALELGDVALVAAPDGRCREAGNGHRHLRVVDLPCLRRSSCRLAQPPNRRASQSLRCSVDSEATTTVRFAILCMRGEYKLSAAVRRIDAGHQLWGTA